MNEYRIDIDNFHIEDHLSRFTNAYLGDWKGIPCMIHSKIPIHGIVGICIHTNIPLEYFVTDHMTLGGTPIRCVSQSRVAHLGINQLAARYVFIVNGDQYIDVVHNGVLVYMLRDGFRAKLEELNDRIT